jgi:hypothetical protein
MPASAQISFKRERPKSSSNGVTIPNDQMG